MKNRIAQLRKERRITQEELADAVEVTRQTIISLENGRYNASLLLAHKIAKYFGSSGQGRRRKGGHFFIKYAPPPGLA